MSIEIHDLSTWPSQVYNLLIENQEIIAKNRTREIEILNLVPPDRFDSSKNHNPYKGRVNQIITEIQAIVEDIPFIGYHCARLTKTEIENIRETGFQPTSTVSVEQRIAQLEKEGLISADTATHFLSKPLSKSRLGEIWFFFGGLNLKCEGEVGDLLTYWGGEIVKEAVSDYRLAEDPYLNKLQSIGSPCIVRIFLYLKKMFSGDRLGETLFEQFMFEKGLKETRAGLVYPFTTNISSGNISKIIGREDSEFESLTDFHKWDRKI